MILTRLRLQQQLQLAENRGYVYSRSRQDGEEQGLERRAGDMLERVLIMRVFDFVGVVEAVAEIGGRVEMVEGEGGGPGGGAARQGEVPDSEDEGAEGEEEVERRYPGKKDEDKAGEGEGSEAEKGTGEVGVIVIDSITSVVSSVITKDHVHGTYSKFNTPFCSPPNSSGLPSLAPQYEYYVTD